MTKRDLTDEDQALWDLVTRNVKAYRGRAPVRPRHPASDPPPVSHAPVPVPAPRLTSPLKPGETAGLDWRTARRLKRGALPVEARLDLHGLTVAEAEAAVSRFIVASSSAGRRCLLLVTGKGEGTSEFAGERRGRIRREAPHWLAGPRLRPLILAVMPAAPSHGGSGALYVLLKRRAD
jgi:DNA-nicking Smr family endonuclease